MRILFWPIVLTALFCLAIGFDVSPFLRGPAPYIPEWRWEYFFVNTLDRIYFPLGVILILLGIFLYAERNKIVTKKYASIYLLLLVVLFFSLEMGVLFFSRAGIPVLLNRIISPTLNSYFTASLVIQDIPAFLHTYNNYILHLEHHAQTHPPSAMLFFYMVKQIVGLFPVFIDFVNTLKPSHEDVASLWNSLKPIDKTTALTSAFLIPLLSCLTIIPVYLTTQIMYGSRVALRSVMIFIFFPSMMFFIPINDAFLPLFSATSLYLMVKGIYENKLILLFLSGIVLFAGASFTLLFLPLLLFFFLFFTYTLYLRKSLQFKKYIVKGCAFVVGFFLPAIVIYMTYKFNFLEMIHVIMSNAPHMNSRSYTLWIFYNLYDFFIFSGIPVTVAFLLLLKNELKKVLKKKWKHVDSLFISFFLFLLVLNFSGTTRGEVARIWLPLLPFLAICVAAFLTNNMKISTKYFVVFLLLQGIQMLVMQEFWVMLW